MQGMQDRAGLSKRQRQRRGTAAAQRWRGQPSRQCSGTLLARWRATLLSVLCCRVWA